MCSICGCSIDAGDPDGMFSKEYRCLDCKSTFKQVGVIPICPSCKSRNAKRLR